MEINRKGIILAGGSGSRLYPSTKAISKQLVPVYDKPMIYYPLCTLMEMNINEICIISTPEHIGLFEKLLGDGSEFGLSFTYIVQGNPNGLAESFLLAEDFLDGSACCLILGDNIFIGESFIDKISEAVQCNLGSSIFAYKVRDPERFGVVEFNEDYKVISIEEKPKNPKSNYAVTGIYFYDQDVVEYAKSLRPSPRGELEITDLNNIYLNKGNLSVEIIPKDSYWLDAGTPKSLMEASNFIYELEQNKSKKISCPEEISIYKNWIEPNDFAKRIKYATNEYDEYIFKKFKL